LENINLEFAAHF